uniref:Protein kinase domain-containing protein n=1 Tax=Kalanchoe fedtschenkoi TaxID=63787 RepID=A0A7N0V355_KALFE
MKYLRSRSLKRLFSMKRRRFDEEPAKDGDGEEMMGRCDSLKVGGVVEGCFQKPTWKCFSFEEIFEATDGFISENVVGRGGYAEVYRGKLKTGEAIAVKRLTKACTDDERKEKEFLTEIGTMGHVCHPNVSSLLGCCLDHGLYLIFQFSVRGSVASILHNEKLPAMDWKTRYKIAVGTAKGLHYLHKGCQRRIIHRDIKASNILLTDDFEPQISDFGLAKWLPSQWTHHSIVPIEGTFGYLAPEYFMHGIVDEKTDVFAFGVFILEIISGRKPVYESHQCLHSWARPLLNQGDVDKLIDPKLTDKFDDGQMRKLAFAASLCIRVSGTWRPTMSEVLEVIFDDHVDEERWKMPEEEGQGEFWGFEDLESECDSSIFTELSV